MTPRPAPLPDDALAAAARNGDRSALDTLLRRHHDRLWLLCRRITSDRDDADDALQEAMISIARGIRRFDGRSTFGTWAYRVTTNACLDELRRRRRRPDPVEIAPHHEPTDPAPGTDAVPQQLDVDAALLTLSHEFRVAVVLRDLCDLDYAQIGEITGAPPGTVRSRIARGRAQLARALGNSEAAVERPRQRR